MQAMFSPVFIIFAIILIGYLIGKINIKGVSLGSAGVFVSALVFGILLGLFWQDINAFGHNFAPYVWNSTAGTYAPSNLIGWISRGRVYYRCPNGDRILDPDNAGRYLFGPGMLEVGAAMTALGLLVWYFLLQGLVLLQARHFLRASKKMRHRL